MCIYVPSIRSSTFHGLLVSPRDDGFRCDQIYLDTHIGDASAVKKIESPALIWVGGLDLKKEKKRKRKRKKRKKKGKLEKRRCGLQAKMGLSRLWLARTAASFKLQSSLRFISTLFPFTWFPLYTFVSLFLYNPFNSLITLIILITLILTQLSFLEFPPNFFFLRISHLPLYYVTEIKAPASHLSV